MKITNHLFLLYLITLVISSCESDAERKLREAKEEQQRIELETQKKQKEEAIAFQKEQQRLLKEKQEEQARIEREIRLEKERREKETYNKYINNKLYTGATPYDYCYGKNESCAEYGCSEIKVRTPSNSDVIVTIKLNGKVNRHAYIHAGSSYSFEVPNGIYQVFFYYGKGWNPNKFMKETYCGALNGGFIANEHFGKDSPQTLRNNILEYELILQQNGNFSTQPSTPEEAF